MNYRVSTFIAVTLFLYGSAAAQEKDPLHWLTGLWTIDTGKGHTVETWRQANDSTLLGRSVFVKYKSDTVLQETLELSRRSGEWAYRSTVVGQNNGQAIIFKLIFLKGQEFICENPEHDFPQRISYRRIGDRLYASIEGKNNGKFVKRNFDFTRY